MWRDSINGIDRHHRHHHQNTYFVASKEIMYLPQNTLAQQQHFLFFFKWIYMTWSSCSPFSYKLEFSKHHSYLPFLPSLSSPSFLRVPQTNVEKEERFVCIQKNTTSNLISYAYKRVYIHFHPKPNFLFFGVLCFSWFYLLIYFLLYYFILPNDVSNCETREQ